MADGADAPASPSSPDPSPAAAELNLRLKRLRTHRNFKRSSINKLVDRIRKLNSADPDVLDAMILSNISRELSVLVRAHEEFQAQILDLLVDDESAYDVEAKAVDEFETTIADYNVALDVLQDRHRLWSESNCLVDKIEHLLDITATPSSSVAASCQAFERDCAPVLNSAKCHRDIPAFAERFRALQVACKTFRERSIIPSSTSSYPAPPPAPSSSGHHHALKVDVPTFDGDPENWEQFEVLFRSTIANRAKGYNTMEVRGLLQSAVKPEHAKRLLHNLPDTGCSLDAMLQELKAAYGTPDIVCPLLLRKIQSVSSLPFNYQGMMSLVESVCLPWQRFVSIAGPDSSAFLAAMVVQYMDDACRQEWLRSSDSSDVPKMEKLLEFAKKWSANFKASSSVPASSSTRAPPPASSFPALPSTSSAKNPPRKQPSLCIACGDNHQLMRCEKFKQLDVSRRNQLVRDHRMCLNCFSSAHGYRSCPNKHSCKTCNGRHHTLLHKDRESPASGSSTPASSTPPVLSTQPITSPVNTSLPAEVTLPRNPRSLYTAVVTLAHGQRQLRARALLDSGASIAVMAEQLACDAGLPRVHERLPVEGIGGTTHSKFGVVAQLSSRSGNFTTAAIAFTVIPRLKKLDCPLNAASVSSDPAFATYHLADPDLGGDVDIILPLSVTSELTTGSPFSVGDFIALPTRLGLCLSGPTQEPLSRPPVLSLVPDNLVDDLSTLWELDRVPAAPTLSPEDEKAVDDFHSSFVRKDNRFHVQLPRVKDPPLLGDSRRMAVSRLLANERSLSSKGKLEAFDVVMREYMTLDHAELVPKSDLSTRPHCYLPVHGVFKDSSTTTKCRAVFDASARTSSGASLNDTLLAGPTLYPPLVDVLIRFRRHQFAMSSDISKMFREIMLLQPERDLHRFLLRDSDGIIQDCRMKRLTFGVKSSPFLATQVLRTLADLHASSHPAASAVVHSSFYVDDCLTSVPDVSAAISLRQELCDLLSRAGITLRKWRSNSAELLDSIPVELQEPSETDPVDITPPYEAHKALGVHWDTSTDSLFVAVPPPPDPDLSVTKRIIASGTAAVFDLLGLLCPSVIQARILFQETWKQKLPWDKPVPEDIRAKWSCWLQDLPLLKKHPIPRRLTHSDSPVKSSQLHGFSDASTVAYGAAVYLRTVHMDGQVSITLVLAKARVLPVRPITVPRAELTGAVLLADLLAHCSPLLDILLSDVFAWTDSEIVLRWLPKTPVQLDRFVSHRVYKIQQTLPGVTWRHVSSEFNPADLASRGVPGSDLTMSALWWSGPPWLSLPQDQWPRTVLSKPSPVFAASIRRPSDMPASQRSFLRQLWTKYDSFFKLVRVMAWLLRFVRNARHPKSSSTSSPDHRLTFEEIELSKSKLYLLSQQDSLPDAVQAATSKSPSSLPSSHLLAKYLMSLSPLGHVDVQSRVRDPSAPTSPLRLTLLSAKSPLTKLLVSSLHKVFSHAGPTAMASILASSYLIPNLRNLLKQVSRNCLPCQRAYAKPLSHMMGMLPVTRTSPAPPFWRTGVDFAGPLTLRLGHTRKPTILKSYAVIFVCLTTKAVHFDLCTTLSTADYMATFQRFVARRGCPAEIFSDNGSNFIGAREELRQLQQLTSAKSTTNAIQQFATQRAIKWHFIPPRAPHFGGLWEAAVKSMKLTLRKRVQPHALRWDELYTVLAEAEAILNSRPLAPLHSDSAAEGNFLTAGHFLIGRPLAAPPEQLASTSPTNSLRRWNLVQRVKADLWKAWSSSYLASMAARGKWRKPGHTIKPNDLVLVKDETLKNRDWPLGKVEAVHPGDDGAVRAATIRCQGRTYKRPTCKLVPLLFDDDASSTSQPSPSPPPPRSMSGTANSPDNDV